MDALSHLIVLMAIVLILVVGQRLITLEKRLSAFSRIDIKHLRPLADAPKSSGRGVFGDTATPHGLAR